LTIRGTFEELGEAGIDPAEFMANVIKGALHLDHNPIMLAETKFENPLSFELRV
jgi:hypothetical protein